MFKNIEAIREAKTSELVTFYNAHNVEKPVTKFSDRKTAEKRCIALFEALSALEEAPVAPAAPAVTHKPRKVAEKKEVDTDNLSDEEFKAQMLSGSERKSNAAAIAASWANPDVYNARLKRDGVAVTANGKTAEFKSVRAAFAALNLPDSKHIRFRMKLKEAKSATFEWAGNSYRFDII